MTIEIKYTFNNGKTSTASFSGRKDVGDALSLAGIGLQVGDSITILSIT